MGDEQYSERWMEHGEVYDSNFRTRIDLARSEVPPLAFLQTVEDEERNKGYPHNGDQIWAKETEVQLR